MKFTELLLFWLGMVLGMVAFKMVAEVGVLHRIWPQRFDAPAVVRCSSSSAAVLDSQAQGATDAVAAVAHG